MLRQNQQIDREMDKEAHSLHGLQLQRIRIATCRKSRKVGKTDWLIEWLDDWWLWLASRAQLDGDGAVELLKSQAIYYR